MNVQGMIASVGAHGSCVSCNFAQSSEFHTWKAVNVFCVSSVLLCLLAGSKSESTTRLTHAPPAAEIKFPAVTGDAMHHSFRQHRQRVATVRT